MKKLVLSLIVFLFFSVLNSCSNNDENLLDSPESASLEEIEPYISPKMAETIAFLDTCTSVVPIEQLFPMIDIPTEIIYQEENSLTIKTKAAIFESYKGKTSQKILYEDKAVSISNLQIINWKSVLGNQNIPSGTYYLTAIAVYYQLLDDRTITKSYFMGTDMGVDPDDDTSIGYTLQQLSPSIHLFTSYVYALKTGTGQIYSIKYVPVQTVDDIYGQFSLTWYYFAE